MSRTGAIILSLVLAVALGIMTALAMECAISGWGIRPHEYAPPSKGVQNEAMKDYTK